MKKSYLLIMIAVLGISLIACNPSTTKKIEEEGKNTQGEEIKETENESGKKEDIAPETLVKIADFDIELADKEPDSLGNIWTDAVVTNNSKYPILEFRIVLLPEYDGQRTYLVLNNTQLPGETSYKFETITGVDGKEDKYSTVEYRYKVLVDDEVYEIEYDVESDTYTSRLLDDQKYEESDILVKFDELKLVTEVTEADETGMHRLKGHYKNNSNYDINRNVITLVSKTSNSVGYLLFDDEVKVGESSEEFDRKLGEEGKVEFDIIEYEYYVNKDGKEYKIVYDTKLERYSVRIKD